eukprot:1139-Heterococcus_DN1.PRE.2
MELESDRPAEVHKTSCCSRYVADAGQRDVVKIAFDLSWAVNILLLLAKIYAFATTGSKAVAASLADSGVDILSQIVLGLSTHLMHKKHEDYPVGRHRLEQLGVIACSCIMSIAALEVIQFAIGDLIDGFKNGNIPEVELSIGFYLILGGGTVAKLLLWQLCRKATPRSDSLDALAEDHLNDVASTIAAIATAVLAATVPSIWWIDGIGAIVISLWIVSRWFSVTKQQSHKLIGKSAPDDFIDKINSIANEHHDDVAVDSTRAYHFGAAYIVEMEILMPAETRLRDSHDIALDLQQKLEGIDEIERAFVHVDHTHRDVPEHKVERLLQRNSSSYKNNGNSNGNSNGNTSPRP